jgi:hypothetical protein
MTSPNKLKRCRGKSLILALLSVGLVALLPSLTFGQGSTWTAMPTLYPLHPYQFRFHTIVRVSGTSSGAIANGYVRYDFSLAFPPGTTSVNIAKGTLKLYLSKVTSPGTLEFGS